MTERGRIVIDIVIGSVTVKGSVTAKGIVAAKGIVTAIEIVTVIGIGTATESGTVTESGKSTGSAHPEDVTNRILVKTMANIMHANEKSDIHNHRQSTPQVDSMCHRMSQCRKRR